MNLTANSPGGRDADTRSTITQRPPFALPSGASLDFTARSIEDCFAVLPDRPEPLCWCIETMVNTDGWSDSHPLLRAASVLARRLDISPDAQSLPYHNRLHSAEVVLAAHYLGLRLQLPFAQHAELVLAAVIHDLDHDGGRNAGEPFRLERRSHDHARSALESAGVPTADIERLRALVLATDIVHGLPRARAWYRYHFGSAPRPQGDEPDTAFALFAADPVLVLAAVALTEADALSSAGLSTSRGFRQQRLLAREQGWPVRPGDKRRYLDTFFPDGFLVAHEFNPNLEAMRACVEPF